MKRLIEKSAVVAEIDALQDTTMENGHFLSSYHEGIFDGLSKIENFIDTLETKEVDLEKELETLIEKEKAFVTDNREVKYYNGDSFNHIYELEFIAKHFYELGLKAKKGK
jgi:hypothetical protein